MKLRIRGNSIRIRLSRTEVDSLGKGGYIQETTEFGGSIFTYALQSKEGISALTAAFSNGKITMFVPAHLAAEWPKNETVGYENHLDIGNSKQLFLLLEKDFKC